MAFAVAALLAMPLQAQPFTSGGSAPMPISPGSAPPPANLTTPSAGPGAAPADVLRPPANIPLPVAPLPPPAQAERAPVALPPPVQAAPVVPAGQVAL